MHHFTIFLKMYLYVFGSYANFRPIVIREFHSKLYKLLTLTNTYYTILVCHLSFIPITPQILFKQPRRQQARRKKCLQVRSLFYTLFFYHNCSQHFWRYFFRLTVFVCLCVSDGPNKGPVAWLVHWMQKTVSITQLTSAKTPPSTVWAAVVSLSLFYL